MIFLGTYYVQCSYFLETRGGYPFFPHLSFESSHQYYFFHCFMCDINQLTAQKNIVIYFWCSTNWYKNTKQYFSPPISLNIFNTISISPLYLFKSIFNYLLNLFVLEGHAGAMERQTICGGHNRIIEKNQKASSKREDCYDCRSYFQ